LENRPAGRKRWIVTAVIVAAVAAQLGYRGLVYGHLAESAALFIGLPAFLAILIVLLARPASSAGLVVAVIAVLLLLSPVALGEGAICVLMAAPLFLGAALLVVGLVKLLDRLFKRGGGDPRLPGLIFLPLLLMSLEGVDERLSFPRAELVSSARTVAASADQVEQALAGPTRFAAELPPYLQLGFPRPLDSAGHGLEPGDRRVVRFTTGSGGPTELILEVVEHNDHLARFRIVSDTTPLARWLTFREAVVEWRPLDPEQTVVRWTIQYDRRLDPAWYFAPWERYGVGLAVDYLIRTVATPADGR
jgi:hypothetical protein